MRGCHAQSVKLPIQLARFRMRHATNELKRIPHLKRNVNSIDAARGKCSVMNSRRQGMRDWLAHDAEDLSVKINLIDPENIAQIFDGQLAGSGSAFFLKRSIG